MSRLLPRYGVDSEWVQARPGKSPRKYNRAWRRAVQGACATKRQPAPFIVYLIENTFNGMRYVGATKKPLRIRWKEHREDANSTSCRGLLIAIRQYGKDSFRMRILSEALNEVVAYELERFWIRELRTLFPNGYNMNDGGIRGFQMTPQARRNMRGPKHTPEGRRAIGDRFRGKPRSQETREKIRLGNIKVGHNEWLGRKHTPETRLKMSLSALKRNRSKTSNVS